MALCHRSQVFEWLPWTDGKEKPITEQEWRGTFVERHRQLNRQHGFQDDTPSEFYRVTRWGRKPKEGEIERIFPKILARKGI
jgi:hypothetical protein